MTTLTTAQAAAQLGVSDRRVRQWIASGSLPATRHGRDWLIKDRDVARFVPGRNGRPPKPRTPRTPRKQENR